MAINLPSDINGIQSLASLYYAYSAPGRHYHNLNHITDCFRELRKCLDMVEDEAAMRMAIWYHDVIYDATRNDNELRSADAAHAAALAESGDGPSDASKWFADKVHRLVMMTTHDPIKHEPVTYDEKLMCDIDLSALAADAKTFEENNVNIRQEYAHVPDAAFYTGRKALFQKFLDRPYIYYTEYFRQRYEKKARTNMMAAIA